MARKPIIRVNDYVLSNLDDRDSIITILLKRFCTFEEAVDYLLSAVPRTLRDDMLGELSTWDIRTVEMMRTRSDWRARQTRTADSGMSYADKVAGIKKYRAAGYPFREIAAEFDVSISTVKALTAKEPR
jgi:hypothetical protein